MMGRKGVAVLVMALVAAHAVASWWVGRVVEARYAAVRGRLLLALGIAPESLVAHRYERGVFSATVTDVLVLDLPPLSGHGMPHARAAGAFVPAGAAGDASRARPVRCICVSTSVTGRCPVCIGGRRRSRCASSGWKGWIPAGARRWNGPRHRHWCPSSVSMAASGASSAGRMASSRCRARPACN